MGPFGFQELIVIFFVALLVFGPRKLPELGKSLGKGLREFRKASNELKASWDDQIRDAESSVKDVKQTFKQTGAEIHQNLNETVRTVERPSHPAEPAETVAESGQTVPAEETRAGVGEQVPSEQVRGAVKSDGRAS